MNVNDILCQAIRERRLVELQYHGHTRIVAPHVYGLDATGAELLSGYQIRGGSDSGAAAGWKSFRTEEILALKITDRRFGPRAEYRHDDRAMTRIFCQI